MNRTKRGGVCPPPFCRRGVKNMAKDMTEGSPFKIILAFCVPMLLGNIFQQFYSMVDTIIVGRYVGEGALAAVGSTGAMVFLILGFAMGIASGFGVWVAQFFGARDYDNMRHYVAMSLVMTVFVSLTLTILTVWTTEPMLHFMHTPEDIFADATAYVKIIFGGIACTMFYNVSSAILRSVGDSKTPLYFLILASVLNVILDLYFIVSLKQGAAGAAYATVISQGVSAVLCIGYMFWKFDFLRLKRKDWKFSFTICTKLLVVGIPMALQFSITAIGIMVLQMAINNCGSTAVAAFTAASKVEQLATQPMNTLGTAMATYGGQNIGAARYDRLKSGIKAALQIAVGATLFAMAAVWLFGPAAMRIFLENPSAEVMEYGLTYLHTISWFFLALAILFIFRNFLQGIGKGLVPLIGGISEMIMRTVVALVIAKPFGYAGICYASPAAWIGAAIPLTIAYLYYQKQW